MKRLALFLAVAATLFTACSKKEVLPQAVALDRHELSLEVGDTFPLKATVTPADATNPAIVWSSNKPAVATVDENGKVTALTSGNAVITVATVNGGKTDACSVSVSAKPGPGPEPGGDVSEVTIKPASAEVKEGETVQLSATVTPADASQAVEWASLDTSVATVDENGLVKGVAQGSTKIFARSKADPDKQGSCEITVIQDPTLKGIALSATELNLKVGQAQTLTVIYTPSYASNKNVTWTSDDSSVATVSAEGKVTALAEGSATVTATSEEGGFTASCAVTVSKSEGIRVYCTLVNRSGDPFYLNGEEDPLNGQYKVKDEGYTYLYDRVRVAYSIGGDLYTVERFQRSDAYYIVKVYLCKNRVPLYELPLESSKDDSVLRMTVNESGDAAVIVQAYSGKMAHYVVIVKADGSTTSSKIEGDFNGLYNPCIAWASSELYVAGDVKDVFTNDSWLSTFKYTEEGWIHTKIVKDQFPNDMEASASGDIYILTNGHTYGTVIFKNGKVDATLTEASYTEGALQVSGGHVYAAVYDVLEEKAMQYCDGTLLRTFEFDDKQTFYNDGMYVSSSGDFYMSTWNYIYKNDSRIYTFEKSYGPIDNFCVVE